MAGWDPTGPNSDRRHSAGGESFAALTSHSPVRRERHRQDVSAGGIHLLLDRARRGIAATTICPDVLLPPATATRRPSWSNVIRVRRLSAEVAMEADAPTASSGVTDALPSTTAVAMLLPPDGRSIAAAVVDGSAS